MSEYTWAVVAKGKLHSVSSDDYPDRRLVAHLNERTGELQSNIKRAFEGYKLGHLTIDRVRIRFYAGSVLFDAVMTGVGIVGAQQVGSASLQILRIILIDAIEQHVRTILPTAPATPGSFDAVTVDRFETFVEETRRRKEHYFYTVIVPMFLGTILVALAVAAGVHMEKIFLDFPTWLAK